MVLQEEIDSLRRNNTALVEKAKKYRSEARAAGTAPSKEKERSVSPEPVKRKAVQARSEIVVESEEEKEEVVKAPKRAVRHRAIELQQRLS